MICFRNVVAVECTSMLLHLTHFRTTGLRKIRLPRMRSLVLERRKLKTAAVTEFEAFYFWKQLLNCLL